jgi:hypothetical protein
MRIGGVIDGEYVRDSSRPCDVMLVEKSGPHVILRADFSYWLAFFDWRHVRVEMRLPPDPVPGRTYYPGSEGCWARVTGHPGEGVPPAVGEAMGAIEVTGWDPAAGRLSGSFQLWGWWDALPGLPNPMIYDGWFVAYRD